MMVGFVIQRTHVPAVWIDSERQPKVDNERRIPFSAALLRLEKDIPVGYISVEDPGLVDSL